MCVCVCVSSSGSDYYFCYLVRTSATVQLRSAFLLDMLCLVEIALFPILDFELV